MGLEQYGYAVKGEEVIQFAYWRKHADLQGWMENLYKSRGGREEFNAIPLKLSAEDLDHLSVEHEYLDVATGCFWGRSYEEDIDATNAFLKKAKEYVAKGYTIEYFSWW